ncbi:MAG: hypothetical protein ACOCUH_01795 [Bacteriovoracia bacterium]
MLRVFIIFSLVLGAQLSFADDLFKPFESSKAINQYLKLHKQFFKKTCSNSEDHKYQELLKNYRADGYFVPAINETILDMEAITANIPAMKEKIKWLEEQIKFLKTNKKLPSVKKEITALERLEKLALKHKKEYFDNLGNKKLQRVAQNKSSEVVTKIKSQYDLLLAQIPYLLNFRFPVDHFDLRRQYEQFVNATNKKDQKNKNRIYLYRKIIEDGSFDKNHRYSDIQARSVISTLKIRFADKHKFLTEDLRYDLDFVIKQVNRFHRKRIYHILTRLNQWMERSRRALVFYQNLIMLNKNNKKSNLKLLQKRSQTRYQLKDFVLKNQAKVYQFWHKQSELMKAIYVMDTILFNEVGVLDGKDALERKDVAQVVINRTKTKEYNYIRKNEPFYSYLQKLFKPNEIAEEHWLNVLFKKGQFSFTYYFISGAVNIFCPDMSPRGRRIRRKNLKLITDLLRKSNWDFDGLRYFSRGSMIGHIDMTRLWKNYTPIPERPGKPLKVGFWHKNAYRNNRYRFLYTFLGQDKKTYDVIKIRNRKYVVHPGKKLGFFTYRNPHLFTYFRRH